MADGVNKILGCAVYSGFGYPSWLRARRIARLIRLAATAETPSASIHVTWFPQVTNNQPRNQIVTEQLVIRGRTVGSFNNG